jgi:DNA-binding NarL/FixJ family response regulator
MMDSPIRVLVLCSNRLLRESIARIIKKRTDFQVIASQSLGSFSADELAELRADVLVCDSLLFIQEGRSLRLQATKASIKSVLVAMDDNPENFLTAVRSGVLGYVLQEAAAAEVVSAIRGVAAGEAVCPSRLTKLLFDYIASQPDLSAGQAIEQPRLTRREQQLILTGPTFCTTANERVYITTSLGKDANGGAIAAGAGGL